MQKTMEIGREKECYTLLTEGGVTSLHHPEDSVSGASRELISGNLDSPPFPHIGEPPYWGTLLEDLSACSFT